jgi:cytochrome P450
VARSIDEAPYLDIFAAVDDDPGTVINELRQECWFARTPIGMLVIRREQVHALLADPRLNSSLAAIARMQGADGALYELVSSSILAIDGPNHTRLRKLVSRAFTPRSVETVRPFMHELAGSLVDEFAATGTCEFMQAFADRYPIQVICEHLGVPREDHELFARFGDDLTWVLSLELMNHLEEAQRGVDGMLGYIKSFVAERRADPRDDLVSRLILAEDEGDHLSEDELHMLIASMLFAGLDTTRNQLGLCMVTFADHPDQWALLAEQPELAEQAVEECMRFAPTIGIAPRMAAETFEFEGFEIPAGTLVSLSTSSANYDPAAFVEPETFDITAVREPIFTFGGGPHYCLGASLARAEMQVALPLLAQRMPGLQLAGEVQWRPRMGIFGPTFVPLRFTPAS